MKIRLSIALLLILIPGITWSAGKKYPVSDIPKELLPDAKAVIRKNDYVFEIKSINQGVARITRAITILNKNGLVNSIFEEAYNKYLSVRKINTTIYDRNGNVVGAGLGDDLKDYAMLSGYSLYDEYRVKYLDPQYSNFPFTIEFEYEVSFDGLFSYPVMVFYEDYNISVENASLTVIAPEGFMFRYLEHYLANPCKIATSKGKTSYIWTASALPARRKELYSLSLKDISPAVFLAPNDFEIGGYKGNCETWENMGKWIGKLGEYRNALNAPIRDKINSLISGADSVGEKVRLLYEYMQNKVRYVSITQGMGGWQPFDAATVEQVSYGDCKALANYMKALLDVAGIKSYYVLISAGEDASAIKEDFPSNQFNHAIVCVPIQNDTLWLECTDQRIPFGFLGSFTDDRKCLVICESGGKIARTKVYSVKDNTRNRKIEVTMDDKGAVTASMITNYRGLYYDDASIVERLDGEDKKRFINKLIDLPGFSLLGYTFTLNKAVIPAMHEEMKISVPNYAYPNGKGLIFKPDFISRIKDLPVRTARRESPVIIRRSYHEIDTVVYITPGPRKPESGTGKVSFSSPYGEYSADFSTEGNKLIYVRSLILKKGVYPPGEYDSFVDFYEKVQAEDNRQLVLNKL